MNMIRPTAFYRKTSASCGYFYYCFMGVNIQRQLLEVKQTIQSFRSFKTTNFLITLNTYVHKDVCNVSEIICYKTRKDTRSVKSQLISLDTLLFYWKIAYSSIRKSMKKSIFYSYIRA